ncbi:MAG: hypothetical protein MRJ68_11650 [Nitrospira sp.]|nr:hypothetical protein [Nitrospira sp.]
MQSPRSMTTPQWEGEESGYQALPSRLADCLQARRRQIIVSQLFEYLKDVQRIDDGYALQFDRSDDPEELIGIMADYILFEGVHSPQLTFAIVGDPQEKVFWLQVREAST